MNPMKVLSVKFSPSRSFSAASTENTVYISFFALALKPSILPRMYIDTIMPMTRLYTAFTTLIMPVVTLAAMLPMPGSTVLVSQFFRSSLTLLNTSSTYFSISGLSLRSCSIHVVVFAM